LAIRLATRPAVAPKGQSKRDEEIIERSLPATGRVADTRIGAANVRAERALEAARVSAIPSFAA